MKPEYESIGAQLRQCIEYLAQEGHLKPGATVVLGCSTSEVAGARIGKGSVPELGGVIAQAMLDACKAAGLRPVVRSSYRSQATQKRLYENKVSQWKGYGYSEEEARKKAATIVAVPGTSEHQLGLAVDIIDYNYPYLNEQQETMPTQKWLMENSWRYGFILRYPNEKSDITGIIYEPWHYRYVGEEAAAEIYELGVTLEEYLDMFYEPLE